MAYSKFKKIVALFKGTKKLSGVCSGIIQKAKQKIHMSRAEKMAILGLLIKGGNMVKKLINWWDGGE